MPFDITVFLRGLEYELGVFNFTVVTAECNKLIAFLTSTNETVPLDKAEKILQRLRNKLQFENMLQVGDALINTGRVTCKIKKLYAQALIDLGHYTGAIAMLESLIRETDNIASHDIQAATENAEAKGLIGRVYKQLYVNAYTSHNQRCKQYLSLAINAYYEVYKTDPEKVWHGINTVALIERAGRDQVQIDHLPDAQAIARQILDLITWRYDDDKAEVWDFATAAEACLALRDYKEALKWLSGYARMPNCDAFELNGTRRQLEEVWQLDLDAPAGQLLLPILRAELTSRLGGGMVLDIKSVKKQKVIEHDVTNNYQNLVEERIDERDSEHGIAISSTDTIPVIKLEKVFGEDSFKTFKWYMTGVDRCMAIARIGKDSTKGMGTGFLLKGKELKKEWADEWLLITNAHVVSDDVKEGALKSHEAIVIFEALDGVIEFRDFEILWTSPSNELDATLLRFNKDDQERLQQLMPRDKDYPVSKYLPAVEEPPAQKIYIIGHPGGGTLQLSFLDNLLIDHDKVSKIHYRTPTEGGSSGSPVFNQQWDLIGLHHAGAHDMPRLNGKQGYYEANEGIWIQAIKNKING